MFQWDSYVHLSSWGRVCWCMQQKQFSHSIDYCRRLCLQIRAAHPPNTQRDATGKSVCIRLLLAGFVCECKTQFSQQDKRQKSNVQDHVQTKNLQIKPAHPPSTQGATNGQSVCTNLLRGGFVCAWKTILLSKTGDKKMQKILARELWKLNLRQPMRRFRCIPLDHHLALPYYC